MYVCIHVCVVITYSRVWINRVRSSILLVVSWTGKMNISLFPFAPENLVSRNGFGRPVPRQPAHLHTQAESGAYLRDSSRVPRRRPFIYLYRQPPSGQSRVYQATQLRTDGVHCLESTGTRPLVLKAVPMTGAALAGHHGPINVRLSFPTPTIGTVCRAVGMLKISETDMDQHINFSEFSPKDQQQQYGMLF